MRLVTFERENRCQIGIYEERDNGIFVLDLSKAAPALPDDMIAFLESGEKGLFAAQNAVKAAGVEDWLSLEAVKLKAPIPRPGKIICVGLNYMDHAKEGGREVPDYPTIFNKYSTCVIGPGEDIVMPRVTSQVDYEAELAVVMGRKARYVSEAEALDYVAGYVPFNDVSGRDYQMRTTQWTLGKSFDTFGPMGPAIVTREEVPDPGNLAIWLELNGEEMQRSNTRELIFTIPFLVSYLSQVMTLEPGDLISTGTPSGVGVFRQPQVFMKAGDVVEVHIENLGVLKNQVAAG